MSKPDRVPRNRMSCLQTASAIPGSEAMPRHPQRQRGRNGAPAGDDLLDRVPLVTERLGQRPPRAAAHPQETQRRAYSPLLATIPTSLQIIHRGVGNLR
jgi:hypothetical protein